MLTRLPLTALFVLAVSLASSEAQRLVPRPLADPPHEYGGWWRAGEAYYLEAKQIGRYVFFEVQEGPDAPEGGLKFTRFAMKADGKRRLAGGRHPLEFDLDGKNVQPFTVVGWARLEGDQVVGLQVGNTLFQRSEPPKAKPGPK